MTTRAKTTAASNAGSFAPDVRAEPVQLSLASSGVFLSEVQPAQIQEVSRGYWTISDSVTRDLGPGQFRVTLGGIPHLRARNRACAALHRELNDGEIPAKLKALAGKNATLMSVRDDGTVEALEGRLITYQDRPFLMSKGSKSRGFFVDKLNVLDVSNGYGGAQSMANTWQRRIAQFVPAVEKIESFNDVPGQVDLVGDQTPAAAAYMLTHPGFGEGQADGCVFLAVSRTEAEDGVPAQLYGYLYAPKDSGVFSEAGPLSEDDVRRWGGKITDFKPGTITFDDAFKLPDDDPCLVYRRLLGRE